MLDCLHRWNAQRLVTLQANALDMPNVLRMRNPLTKPAPNQGNHPINSQPVRRQIPMTSLEAKNVPVIYMLNVLTMQVHKDISEEI